MLSRFIHTATFFLAIALTAAAGNPPALRHSLQEVEVTARRPLSEIGVQKSPIDSAALRENIALSMADVLSFNSSLFVKSSGRATLSTVSFRGTAPSHTAVLWNGLPVNSPALGMTDFSLIPAYFVDRASLLHGASSLNRCPGGLGGLIDLATSAADIPCGLSLQYVQGAGSFSTFDEFLRISFGGERWSASTRAVLSTSANDFSYINKQKKLNIYDDNHQIIGQYHPHERNTNGSYRDFHLLQQIYYTPAAAHKLGADIWYTGSLRNIAPTTVDFIADRIYDNRQRENTMRSVLSWDFSAPGFKLQTKGGYAHTWLAYDYGFTFPSGDVNKLITSRTHTNTTYLRTQADWTAAATLLISLNLAVNHNNVRTADLAGIGHGPGYNKSRTDCDASLSARWQATRRFALAALLREERNGNHWSPIIPALFADLSIYSPLNLMAKASVAHNYHAPTLNDIYFQPGGNPDLRSEDGFTYDAGLSMATRLGSVNLSGAATWYDSLIDDWIIWLPTNKGFFSPRNMKRVRASGIEIKGAAEFVPFSEASLQLSGAYSWTRSVNDGEPLGPGDKSVGKQIPYVPRHTFTASATLSWRQWALLLKGSHYSKRYTMTSNENSYSGSLPGYWMLNLDLERRFSWKPLDLSAKVAVNNLLNTDYQTIFAHPMPGLNFEFFLSITPKLR